MIRIIRPSEEWVSRPKRKEGAEDNTGNGDRRRKQETETYIGDGAGCGRRELSQEYNEITGFEKK